MLTSASTYVFTDSSNQAVRGTANGKSFLGRNENHRIFHTGKLGLKAALSKIFEMQRGNVGRVLRREIVRKHHIPDLSNWKNPAAFERAFPLLEKRFADEYWQMSWLGALLRARRGGKPERSR